MARSCGHKESLPVAGQLRTRCEIVASWQQRKQRTLLGSIARQHLVKTQKTAHTIVNCEVCKLAIALQFFVDTSSKSTINPITNPNPVHSHSNL
jgi:hypothetical protein